MILVFTTIGITPHPIPEYVLIMAAATGFAIVAIFLGIMYGRLRHGHATLATLGMTVVWSVLLAVALI